jgi:hypothetical protein
LGGAIGELFAAGAVATGVAMGAPADETLGVGIAVPGGTAGGGATAGCGAAKIIVPCCGRGGRGCACGAAARADGGAEGAVAGRAGAGGATCSGADGAGAAMRNVLPHFAHRIATPWGPTRESSIR